MRGGGVAGAVAAALAERAPVAARPRRTPPAAGVVDAAGCSADGAFVRLVRALPIGVILVDRTLRVEFANPAAGTIFGFDADRAIGGHVIEAIPNVEFERRIDDALRGEASVAPLDAARARRAQRTYRVSVYPLTDGGEVQRVVVVLPTIKPLSCASIARAKSFSPTCRTSCARRSRRSNSCSKR